MRSKGRGVLAVLVAALAFSATAAGAAQAEPTYYHEGVAITKAFTVRYGGGWSRLLLSGVKLSILCENAHSTGTISTKGEGTVPDLVYKNCKAFEFKENTTTKQHEEGGEITEEKKVSCTIKQVGGAAGELKLAELKSKLVYRAGTAEKELLVRLEPATGTTLAKFEITGDECVFQGTWEIAGKLLSWTPRVSEETIMGDLLSEATNASSSVKQRFTEYELAGVKTTEVEPKFISGTKNESLAFEGAEQVELEPIEGKRGLFSAHI
jgi:hypothetical protein